MISQIRRHDTSNINDDIPYMYKDNSYMYDICICMIMYQICMHDVADMNDDYQICMKITFMFGTMFHGVSRNLTESNIEKSVTSYKKRLVSSDWNNNFWIKNRLFRDNLSFFLSLVHTICLITLSGLLGFLENLELLEFSWNFISPPGKPGKPGISLKSSWNSFP